MHRVERSRPVAVLGREAPHMRLAPRASSPRTPRDRPSRRHSARRATRRRAAARPSRGSAAQAARRLPDGCGRAARSPTSRRRCRTGSRPRHCGSISGVQPIAASSASVSRSTISRSSPTSRCTRSRNSSPFAAERHASVAISRARVTPRLCILSRQMPSASMARVDRGIAEPAGRRHSLAEPDDARERVDHPEAVAIRARDQEAAIVGAEIERRVSSPRMCRSDRRRDADGAAASADPTGRGCGSRSQVEARTASRGLVVHLNSVLPRRSVAVPARGRVVFRVSE